MTRIVVTGATGNVGSAVVRRLLDPADPVADEVIGIVRRPPEDPQGVWKQVRWVRADLAEECTPTLVEAFGGADTVVHLAWGFQPTHDPGYLEAVGVGGTKRVLDAVDTARVPHLVHQSSIGAYAPRLGLAPVTENWPTTGIASAAYSRHKAAAERLLDERGSRPGGPVLTRLRPTLIGQYAAGGGQGRYSLPAAIPAGLLRRLPLLPLARGLVLQLVHAEEVAEAVASATRGRVGGAFNLAAGGIVEPADIAAALGARLLTVPLPVLRSGATLSWHARLQPVDTGWLDMAYQVPLLDTSAARRELHWFPSRTSAQVLHEAVEGIFASSQPAGEHRSTPPLRPRTVADGLRRALTRRPVSRRRLP